jgi:uncharacterized protein DUF6496
MGDTVRARITEIEGSAAAAAAASRQSSTPTPMSTKYGKKASEKVERAMHEMHEGKLKSGRSGTKVTSRKQAIAIGLSEARKAGGKVPRKRAASR